MPLGWALRAWQCTSASLCQIALSHSSWIPFTPEMLRRTGCPRPTLPLAKPEAETGRVKNELPNGCEAQGFRPPALFLFCVGSKIRQGQQVGCPLSGQLWISSLGSGSKLNHQGTTGFSPWFHLPGFHFGYLFLTHSHLAPVPQ